MTNIETTTKESKNSELDSASKRIITTLKSAYFVFFFIVVVPALVIAFPGLIADHEADWLKEAVTVMKYTTIAFVSLLILFFTAAATLQLYQAFSLFRASRSQSKSPCKRNKY